MYYKFFTISIFYFFLPSRFRNDDYAHLPIMAIANAPIAKKKYASNN